MYKNLSTFDKSLLNYCEEYIHQASQFLAMVGKNYLKDEDDDSNANLGFDENTMKVKGRKVGTFFLDFNVEEWKLESGKNDKIDSSLDLVGRNRSEVFDWLRGELVSVGLNGEQLKHIDHYEIPDHAIDHGQAFPEMIGSIVSIWLTMRTNANILLNELNTIVGVKSEVRIWPHHFDTGTYYSLDENKAIGAGWTMADSLCDNPYLYIYGWNGNGQIDYSSLPELEIGKWIITDNWQGAVIESEELSLAEGQHILATSFMKSVATFLKSELNK